MSCGLVAIPVPAARNPAVSRFINPSSHKNLRFMSENFLIPIKFGQIWSIALHLSLFKLCINHTTSVITIIVSLVYIWSDLIQTRIPLIPLLHLVYEEQNQGSDCIKHSWLSPDSAGVLWSFQLIDSFADFMFRQEVWPRSSILWFCLFGSESVWVYIPVRWWQWDVGILPVWHDFSRHCCREFVDIESLRAHCFRVSYSSSVLNYCFVKV